MQWMKAALLAAVGTPALVGCSDEPEEAPWCRADIKEVRRNHCNFFEKNQLTPVLVCLDSEDFSGDCPRHDDRDTQTAFYELCPDSWHLSIQPVCGPEPAGQAEDQCCYETVSAPNAAVGRPLLIAGTPRFASVIRVAWA